MPYDTGVRFKNQKEYYIHKNNYPIATRNIQSIVKGMGKVSNDSIGDSIGQYQYTHINTKHNPSG